MSSDKGRRHSAAVTTNNSEEFGKLKITCESMNLLRFRFLKSLNLLIVFYCRLIII